MDAWILNFKHSLNKKQTTIRFPPCYNYGENPILLVSLWTSVTNLITLTSDTSIHFLYPPVLFRVTGVWSLSEAIGTRQEITQDGAQPMTHGQFGNSNSPWHVFDLWEKAGHPEETHNDKLHVESQGRDSNPGPRGERYVNCKHEWQLVIIDCLMLLNHYCICSGNTLYLLLQILI